MSKYLLIILVLGFSPSIFSEENYYWHGGQGNWSDVNNWRLENGQMPEQIPNEFDNVIFREESFIFPFDTVYIDINNASCNNIKWINISSPVVFTGSTTTILYIYGSLTLHPNFINNYRGEIHFSSFPGDRNLITKEDSDTITSAGTVYLNHIKLIGVGDYIVLSDDLEFFYDEYAFQDQSSHIYLENGGLDLNGNTLTCGRFLSTTNSERIMNLEDSEIYLKNKDQNVWKVNGENLELNAFNSTIHLTNFKAGMLTEYGSSGNVLQYHDVTMDTILCTIDNTNGIVAYNRIFANSQMCEIKGNFIAGWIELYGPNSAIVGTSTINVVSMNNANCLINGNHMINKCFVIEGKGRIFGTNHINYCQFTANGEFRGENVFDTLLLFAGSGNGVIYTFELGSIQTVTDSLSIRGNPCSNITLKSSTSNSEAYIQKNNGYDLVCDFLNIQGVGVLSENINFYAGANSSAIPDPNNPPIGWIMEDAPGYSYGWNGQSTDACLGEPFLITTENFLGDPWTNYYWNQETTPGESYLEVYESGSYNLRIEYSPSCYIEDYMTVEFDSCESNIAEKDLNNLFNIYPNPANGFVTIESTKISETGFISVYDLNGITQHKEMLNPGGMLLTKRIDISNLRPGIYYVEIKNSIGIALKKLVVY